MADVEGIKLPDTPIKQFQVQLPTLCRRVRWAAVASISGEDLEIRRVQFWILPLPLPTGHIEGLSARVQGSECELVGDQEVTCP